MTPTVPDRVVFYDGECGLCDRSVQWLVKRDRRRRLRYAPLQGRTVAALAPRLPGLPTTSTFDTICFLEGGRVLTRSAAVFAIVAHLGAPWSWLRLFRWVPRALADRAYDAVASRRYRIWGKADACRVPTPEERACLLP